MPHVIGLLLFAAGSWLIWDGLRKRREARTRPAPVEVRRTTQGEQLALMRDAFTPLVVAALAYIAVKMTFVYVILDGVRVFSYVDFAGFLFLIAAFAAWLLLKASAHRQTNPATIAPRIDPHVSEAASDGPEQLRTDRDHPRVRDRDRARTLGAMVGQSSEAA